MTRFILSSYFDLHSLTFANTDRSIVKFKYVESDLPQVSFFPIAILG